MSSNVHMLHMLLIQGECWGNVELEIPNRRHEIQLPCCYQLIRWNKHRILLASFSLYATRTSMSLKIDRYSGARTPSFYTVALTISFDLFSLPNKRERSERKIEEKDGIPADRVRRCHLLFIFTFNSYFTTTTWAACKNDAAFDTRFESFLIV